LTFLKKFEDTDYIPNSSFLGEWIYPPGMITGLHDGLWSGAGDVLLVHLLSWMDDFGFSG
jgi:hypothetical protein